MSWAQVPTPTTTISPTPMSVRPVVGAPVPSELADSGWAENVVHDGGRGDGRGDGVSVDESCHTGAVVAEGVGNLFERHAGCAHDAGGGVAKLVGGASDPGRQNAAAC